MLVITDTATEVIRTIGQHPEQPPDGGLRIATSGGHEARDLVVRPAAAPEDGDKVVEKEGARLFLEEEAAAILDDKVLDAKVDDEGSVQFLLTSQ